MGKVQEVLNTKQLELIEAMIAYPNLSNVALAQKLGINNKTVGKWRKLDIFEVELKKRLQEQWKDAERIAQDTMIGLAAEGDFKASKYILDSLGYAPAQKIEADLHTDICINIEE